MINSKYYCHMHRLIFSDVSSSHYRLRLRIDELLITLIVVVFAASFLDEGEVIASVGFLPLLQ